MRKSLRCHSNLYLLLPLTTGLIGVLDTWTVHNESGSLMKKLIRNTSENFPYTHTCTGTCYEIIRAETKASCSSAGSGMYTCYVLFSIKTRATSHFQDQVICRKQLENTSIISFRVKSWSNTEHVPDQYVQAVHTWDLYMSQSRLYRFIHPSPWSRTALRGTNSNH